MFAALSMLVLAAGAMSAQTLLISPSSVDFGSQPVGVAGNPWTLTVNNTTGAGVTLGTIGVSDANFFSTTTCGASLNAYSSCNVMVGFSPSTSGTINGQLLVTSGPKLTLQAVNLTGNGTGSGSAVSKPNPSFSPSVVDFGSLPVHTTGNAWTATLNNTGAGELDVTALTLSDAADFSYTTDCGKVVTAYSNCHVLVAFTPGTVGPITGTLQLTSNGATQTMSLTGQGAAVASSISVAPAQINFGNQAVGAVSNAQTITVNNTGAGAISLGGLQILKSSDFSVSKNGCGTSLAAHTTCNVEVKFTPSVATSETASLSFSADGVTQLVPMDGTGVGAGAAQLFLSPQTVDFGNVASGTTSGAWTISVNNTSNAAATLSTPFAVSGSTAFAMTTNCLTTIAAHSSCNLTVTFAPTAAGNFTGQISGLLQGSSVPVTVALSGNATSTTPSVIVAPGAATFGSVQTGNTANAWTISVSNPGGAAVTFSSPIALAGSREFQMSTTCGMSLAAYSQCNVSVSFFPVIPGDQTGQLVVNVAGGDKQTVALTGTGVGPALTPSVTLSPGVFTFPATNVGDSAADTMFTLTNTGSTDAYFAARASLSGSASFLLDGSTCGNPIPAGTSCTVKVGFKPTDSTAVVGALTAAFIGQDVPLSAGLNGSGQSAALTFSSSKLDFGTVLFNGPGNTQTITVTNPTTQSIRLTNAYAESQNFIVTNNCPATILPGGSCTVTININTAYNMGTYADTLHFFQLVTSTTGKEVLIPMTGTVVGLGVGPTSMDFGTIVMGTNSAAKTLNLYSDAPVAQSYTTAVTGPFTLTGNCGPLTAASSTCSLNVVFSPTTAGPATGSIVFNFGAGLTETVSLTGVATSGDLQLSTTSVVFAPVVAGTPSTATLVLTNPTSGDLGFSAQFIPFSRLFTLSSGCGYTVPANSTCTLTFSSLNAAPGAYVGNFSVHSSSTQVSHQVKVTDTVSGFYFNVLGGPSSLNFGTVPVGTASTAQTMTLTSYIRQVQQPSFTASGPFTIAGTTCSVPLGYNESCTVSVTFNPTGSGGPATGTLNVGNGVIGTQTVPLSGIGLAPVVPAGNLVSDRKSIDFGNVKQWSSSQDYFTLTNTSTKTILLTFASNNVNVPFSPNNCWINFYSAQGITPGSSCQVFVSLNAVTPGPINARMTVTGDDGSIVSVPVTANNTTKFVNSGLVTSVSAIAFAPQGIGQGSGTESFFVTNTSNTTQFIMSVGVVTTGSISNQWSVRSSCSPYFSSTPLAPGASCIVQVSFTPFQAGTVSDYLTINMANGGVTGPVVNLTGTGVHNGGVVPPSYSINVNPTVLNLTAGNSGTAKFYVQPIGGYKGTINLACSDLTAGTVCSFAPASLVADGSNQLLTSVVTVSVAPAEFEDSSMGLTGLFAAVGLLLLRKRLKLGMASLVAALALAVMLGGVTGCGMTATGQSLGLHSVKVTATAMVNGVQTTQTGTLIVNVTK
jgi:hypothetical protein